MSKKIKYTATTVVLGIILSCTILVLHSVYNVPEEHKVFTKKQISIPDETSSKILEDRKIVLTEMIIKDYILDNQPKVTEKEAERYAKAIVLESKINKTSPYYQAAIGRTESDFDKDAVHALSYVHGMNGVSAKDWSFYLKEKGIIKKDSDLKDPIVNIKASSAIFAYYMERSSTPREAITRYKGYCKVGAERAAQVVKIAVALKNKEKEYIASV